MIVATPDITTPIRTVSTTSPPPWGTPRRDHTGYQFGQTTFVVSVGAIRPSHPMRFQACAPTNGQVLVVGLSRRKTGAPGGRQELNLHRSAEE
jgi:hypothetical protein